MELENIFQLILATFLGALMGLEREYKQKGAGLRTYSLVTLGSCLFTILTSEIIKLYSGGIGISSDLTRIIQAIATGIGFIGAGVIFRQGETIFGLTTAAGLWVTAAVGVAVGVKFYVGAIFSTFLAIFIFSAFAILEERVFRTKK